MCDDVEVNGEDGNGKDADDDGNGNGNDDDGNGEIGDGIGNGDEDDEDEFTDADEAMEDDVTETVDNASDNGEKTKIATDNSEQTKIATDNGVKTKIATEMTDKDSEQISDGQIVTVSNISKCNLLLSTNEIMNENVSCETTVNDEKISIIPSLEQKCSQGGDDGVCGELDEISMDTDPLTEEKKYRQNKNVISEIKDCDGKIVTETNDLLDVIHDYYKHLFSCVSIDMHSVDELLNNVNVKIDDEDVEMCDDEINIEEIEKSLKANDNDSEVIIQRRPDENHADDEDTETVVKSIVSENVHDNESIASENCIEDEAKQGSEAKIQLDGSDKIGKTDVSNLTIVEVEVHNEQNGAPDGLKRKRPISEDGIDDNDDHRTDSSIETDIIESESLVTGTDRELSEGKKIKRDDDTTPSCDTVVGGSDEINDVDMENSLSLNEIISTLVGDEVITTEGAKENEELSVCSGDGYESSVEILDINSDGDVKNVGKFISAKQARKLKKKEKKLERRSRIKPTPNLDGKGVRSVGQNCESTKM
ncbi:protein PFC0760c-like [Mytilus californianus]|uniref:protein PFC0760c-like n=1 Tax=Mytilus californianus TaxID=6549 RepID=UPI002245B44E|nr:protein PFC0760c-like [Mytilus californianus]